MSSPRFNGMFSNKASTSKFPMNFGGSSKDGDKMNSGSREVTISSDARIKKEDSYESLKSGDNQDTIKRKLA